MTIDETTPTTLPTDPADLTLVEAARLIRATVLSPLDLVEAVLKRIDRLDTTVRAYVHVEAEAARTSARTASKDAFWNHAPAPLRGIPIAVKDIIDVAGMPTRAGSLVLARADAAKEDSAVVAALKRAGAIIIGKTTTHEFAYGVISDPTRNPWNLDHLPGGSSGGSAAALAAGMALGAVGTDTAGSIRLPSALCGVVGLKPTHGRIDTRGVIPLSTSLDHVGPMARGVEDAALLFDVLTADSEEPGATLAALTSDGDLASLRAAVVRPYFCDGLAPDVAAAFDDAFAVCSDLGLTVVETALPGVDDTFAVGRAVQRPEATLYHRRYLRDGGHLYTAQVRESLQMGEVFSAADYMRGQRLRAKLRALWIGVMDAAKLDVLLTPTVPVLAPAKTPEHTNSTVGNTLLHNTYPFNLVGFPALSLPCGFGEGDLPVGLQIVGRPGAEATILRVGHAFEQATTWRQRRPALTSSTTRR